MAYGFETGTEGKFSIRDYGPATKRVKSRVQGKVKRKKAYFGQFNRGKTTTTVSGCPDVVAERSAYYNITGEDKHRIA